ncbi:MAG TPA: CBS domain-containing protein [Gammaproteobacteria bacterium]|nr:CBS domain-containing protein [Gammaproteobacteria bacterium]
MNEKYLSLPIKLASADAVLMRPENTLPQHISMQSPALDAMTDLAHVAPVSVVPDLPINQAEEQMRLGNVRLLFVVSERGEWLGLLTYNDLRGGRALKVQGESGVSRGEVLVRDIMTPRARLEVMHMRDVVEARVGDIIETLMRTGRQHALVEEHGADGNAIRGIFSSTRIGKQLGVQLQDSGVAWTFAELEAALH